MAVMVIFTVWSEDEYGDIFYDAFTTRQAAEEYCKQWGHGGQIRETEVFESAPPPWIEYCRHANIYPDKSVKHGVSELRCRGRCDALGVDIRYGAEPHHSGSICGEYVEVHGANPDLVDREYKRLVDAAISRQDGTCRWEGCRHVIRSFSRMTG